MTTAANTTGTFNHSHPTLKKALRGVLREIGNDASTQEVVQFRGLKYGHIKERFARAEMVGGLDLSDSHVVDCTSYGPRCPQTVVDLEGIMFAVPEEYKRKYILESDEFECLNLNITVPKAALEGGYTDKLPVYVYIHGGAYCIGSCGEKEIDPSYLVARSGSTSKPIIGVSISYRLSYFGFAVIPGCTTGNLGLFDQRIALQWIQKHISGFGGDPAKVTISGESAGSVSVDAHLNAYKSSESPELQICRRAWLSSGNTWSTPPFTIDRQIAHYQVFGELLHNHLKEKGKPVQDWIEAYKVSTPEEIFTVVGQVGFIRMPHPTLDGDFFPESPTDLKVYGETASWCEGIVIGDCQNESILWDQLIMTCSADVLVDAFTSLGQPNLPEGTGQKLIKAYNITLENAHRGTLDFINDVVFSYPVYRTSNSWRRFPAKKVYQYAFDQPNPWDAVYRKASHTVDLVYLFASYAEAYPLDSHVKFGKDFQDILIEFVTAEELGDSGRLWRSDELMLFGPDGLLRKVELEGKEHCERRRVEVLRALEKELGDAGAVEALAGVLVPAEEDAAKKGVKPLL